jgi:hypothetical protein
MPLLDGWQVLTANYLPLLQILVTWGLITLGIRTFIPELPKASLGLFLFFTASLILRLAFLTGLSLPLYFDSATHYRIIQSIQEFITSGHTVWPASISRKYYHLGFHTLAAILGTIFDIPVRKVILLLGQVLLSAMPLPVFWLVRLETRSTSAGFLSALLAGFGWFMPAHALNWGKYPALLGSLIAQSVLVIGWSYARTKNRRLLYWLVAGILVSTFAHTRALVLLFIIFASWTLAGMWERSGVFFRAASGVLLLAGLILEIFLVESGSLLKLAFDPYTGDGLSITLTVLLLAFFALWRFPRMAFGSLVVAFFTLACLFLPVTLPAYGYQTLLDRPFVEMVLYLPLALLGGLGGAGILHLVRRRFERGKVPGIVLLILFAPVVLNIFIHYDFYASACCNLVSGDDLLAQDWMDKNLPKDAVVLVPTTELRVLEGNQEGRHMTDAGVWVRPLTGRRVLQAAFNADFSNRTFLKRLCRRGVTHIYVGGSTQSFNRRALNRKTDWYAPALSTPRAKVYNLIGCPKNE